MNTIQEIEAFCRNIVDCWPSKQSIGVFADWLEEDGDPIGAAIRAISNEAKIFSRVFVNRDPDGDYINVSQNGTFDYMVNLFKSNKQTSYDYEGTQSLQLRPTGVVNSFPAPNPSGMKHGPQRVSMRSTVTGAIFRQRCRPARRQPPCSIQRYIIVYLRLNRKDFDGMPVWFGDLINSIRERS